MAKEANLKNPTVTGSLRLRAKKSNMREGTYEYLSHDYRPSESLNASKKHHNLIRKKLIG